MHSTRPNLLMAFDFGLQRIGVAFGNGLTKTVRPVTTIEVEQESKRFEQIERLLKDWEPEGLVVGVPRHPDGQPNELTARCERFARQLEGRFGLPCGQVDERYTSVIAQACGQHSADAKGEVDMKSACLILEQYFLEGR